jgi:hypothetical protein
VFSSSHVVRRAGAATLLLVSLGNTSCYAWHTEHIAPASLLATRQPRQLRVTRTDASQTILKNPVMRADTLVGAPVQINAAEVRIPVADVRQVATRRFSVGRTLGLTLGFATVAVGTVVIVFLINCPGTSACS